ncbi:MAG: type II secretion system protein GspL [Gammaproteobacteria bacterium]|nr:type II secretion system protein GspL [Gammaproteobacteria bacterium]MDE2346081.1 type II secretion system protein GspL [Gammaproteobacteria bacterium]
MSETLLLRMPDSGRPAQWLVVDAFGNSMGQFHSGTLQDAAASASGRRLRVCVPGSAVLLLHANIPSSNSQKILQAVPFALEDRLAQDVDNLHFAVGTRDAQGYPVAVVTKTRMQQWQHELTDAGLIPAEMLPDVLTLPVREKTLVMAPDDRQTLIRFPDGTAISVEQSLLAFMVQKHLSALSAAEACTAALVYAAEEALPPEVREMLSAMQLEVTYRPLSAGPISLMAGNARETRAINLLQGDFILQDSATAHWNRWRIAALLLAVFASVFVIQQAISEFKLRREISQLNNQVGVLFHQALPNVTRMVDPQAQIQQRLAQLTGSGTNSEGLLVMLTDVGTALQTQHSVQIQSFSFHNGNLELQVQADNIDSLNNMKDLLARNPALHVQMDSLNTSSGNTTGRLTVTGSGK